MEQHYCLSPGANLEQEGRREQSDIQMWLQGQHETQARSSFKLHFRAFVLLFTLVFSHVLVCAAGGGDVKIESHKLSIKAKSKIGSLDNVGQGNGQTNGHKVKLKDYQRRL